MCPSGAAALGGHVLHDKERPMKLPQGILLTLLVGLLAIGVTATAQLHTSVASVFEIGVGARALGLGNAFAGLADDETATSHNPAGLASINGLAISSYFDLRFSSYTVLSLCLGTRSFGAAFLQLDSGAIDAVDIDGNPVDGSHYVSRGVILSGGFTPLRSLSVGAKLKLFQSSFQDLHGYAGSLSPALLFEVERVFRLGMVFENLLATTVYYSSGHTEHWCRDVRVGAAIIIGELIVSVEAENILTLRGAARLPHVHIGMEGRLPPLCLRAGINQNMLTAGVGIEWGAFRLDYATEIHFTIPMTHRLAFTILL